MFFFYLRDTEGANKWFYGTKKTRKENVYKIFEYNWNFSKSSFWEKKFTYVTLTENQNVFSDLYRL